MRCVLDIVRTIANQPSPPPQFNYYTKNAELQQLKNKVGQPIDVSMGYDGLEIALNLP